MHLALALVVALVAGAGAPPKTPAKALVPVKKAPAKEPAIVLQLEVVDGAIDAAERVRVEDAVASLLSRHQRIDAVTQREVKRIVDLEAARASAGCDDEGCASEIGAALGARWLIGGRVERAGSQMVLSLQLFDANAAKVVKRATAKGVRFSDVRVQLPFTVDAVIDELKEPGDPAPGDIIEEARAKLAVLPPRLPKLDKAHKSAVDAALDDAAGVAGQKLNLTVLDRAAVDDVAKGAHCKPDDARCTLPAAAAKGASLGLGVSTTATTARATLLQPDGTVVAQSERPIGNDLAAAVSGAVLDVTAKRLGLRVDAPMTSSSSPSSSPSSSTASTTTHAAAADAGERTVLEFACNVMRGIEGVGSRCTLTTTALHIRPHALNLQSQPEDIELADVDSIDPVPMLGFVPTGVRLRMKSGIERVLVVQDRDHVIAVMRDPR